MNIKTDLLGLISELEALEATNDNPEVSEAINQALYHLNHAYDAVARG